MLEGFFMIEKKLLEDIKRIIASEKNNDDTVHQQRQPQKQQHSKLLPREQYNTAHSTTCRDASEPNSTSVA